MWNFLLIFVPLAIVLVVMTVMYFLIWFKIYTTSKSLKKTLGEQSNATKRIVVATTNMSFFIIVFILRFSVPAVHAFWTYMDEPPKILLDIIACATSAGGIFNGIIYLTIRREHL